MYKDPCQFSFSNDEVFTFESEVATEKYIVLLYFRIKNNVSCNVSFLKHSCHGSMIHFYPSLLLKFFWLVDFFICPIKCW